MLKGIRGGDSDGAEQTGNCDVSQRRKGALENLHKRQNTERSCGMVPVLGAAGPKLVPEKHQYFCSKSVRPRRLSELQAGRSADRGRDSGK